MVVRVADLNIGNGETMPFINTTFDEGLDFVGFGPVSQMLTLFRTVFQGIYSTLLEDARINPEKFDIRHDYLDLDGQ